MLIEAKNISKSFARKTALDHVSLAVPKGSIYGLLGPNGAGKTTFIRILTQIIGPDGGEILFGGRKLERNDIRFIGYMPEERGLYKRMKVGEQIMYMAQLKGLDSKRAKKEVEYWFSVFNIKEWWNKKVDELSKGMQQKIQFIITVIHKPELVILDEPFSGFDPVNAEIIREEILKLKDQGTTIILSTHRMESVEELCDCMTLINKAQKIVEGPVEEVRQRFKEHVFEMVISGIDGELPLMNEPSFALETMETLRNGQLHLKFRVGENLTTNQVLQQFLPLGQIISFKEQLPSLNEIFIRLVKEE